MKTNNDALLILRDDFSDAKSIEELVEALKFVYNKSDLDKDDKECALNRLFISAYARVRSRFFEDRSRFFKLLDEAIPMECPRNGGFKGYKIGRSCKAFTIGIDELTYNSSFVIIELYIPEEAKRSSAFGKKCRCDKARVDRITELNTERDLDIAYSNYRKRFKYKLNNWVRPEHTFDYNRFNECASGIHFFMTIDDVLEYYKDLI